MKKVKDRLIKNRLKKKTRAEKKAEKADNTQDLLITEFFHRHGETEFI